MLFDCFFSYHHDDLALVESLVQKLEERNLHCWYAPRNVKGRYAKAIAHGISHSKVFLLLLTPRSAVSEAVLNEVEMAQNFAKNGDCAVIQPVCAEAFDFDSPDFQEMMYYIRRRHFVSAEDSRDFSELADRIIKSQPALLSSAQQRTSSAYIVQEKEDNRLQLQNELMTRFDNDVYADAINQYSNPAILDVGCGTGDMLISKLSDRNISAFVGIDKSARQILRAKQKYSENGFYFYEMDVEAETFDADLAQCLSENKLEKFDLINISMVLLHLKNPVQLLTILHHYLSDDGILIIRDIDDGINFAFPDNTNAFERIYKMCDHDEQSGNRRNGRQIYHQLVTSGFSRIKLERQGFSTAGMDHRQRESLFQMYFPFTLENAKIMSEKYPRKKIYEEDYSWFASCFDEIHKSFMNADFIFSLGFMTYTARK